MTKLPYCPNWPEQMAATDRKQTFSTYDEAVEAAEMYEMSGIGLLIDSGICGIDIDHCVENGVLNQTAQAVMAKIHSYAEYSPSGTGIHIYFLTDDFNYDKGKWYLKNPGNGIETYISGATKRFLTVTGNHINGSPPDIQNVASSELIQFLNEWMQRPEKKNINSQSKNMEKIHVPIPTDITLTKEDHELLAKASTAHNSQKFNKLWNGIMDGFDSQSEADLALCTILAFWTARDAVRMDRLFRNSKLMRPKWDQMRGDATYGEQTISQAIASCLDNYNQSDDHEDLERLRAMNPLSTIGNDADNAKLFAAFYKDRVLYLNDRGCWYAYDGSCWQHDPGGYYTMEYCKQLGELLLKYVQLYGGLPDTEQLKMVHKWKERGVRERLLKDAAGINMTTSSEMDVDPLLLNCSNGTLNLNTMEIQPHNPADHITKCAIAGYDPNASYTAWEQFLQEIMIVPDNPEETKEKMKYLQKAVGYSLTGKTHYDCMFMLYGSTTRNGKSTFVGTIQNMLGGYACAAKPESVGLKKFANGSGPTADIARLNGPRFVSMAQPDKNLELDGALLKTITGGDIMTARFMRENDFDFTPKFKLFMNTNYLPRLSDPSVFNSNRIKVITFDRHFEPWEQDHNLGEKLTTPEMLSGILNWAIEGWKMLQTEGFKEPKSVRDATEMYFRKNDSVLYFIDDCMVRDDKAQMTTTEFNNEYSSWCADRHTTSNSFREVIRKLKDIGLYKKTHDGAVVVGYKLKDPNEIEPLDF